MTNLGFIQILDDTFGQILPRLSLRHPVGMQI